MNEYPCMTDDELALWRSTKLHGGGRRPCMDCPAWFEAASRAAGCCVIERATVQRRAQMREYAYRAGTSSLSTITDAVPLLVPEGTASTFERQGLDA